MVKIRLRRMGAKKAPFYRVVVAAIPAMVASSRRSALTIPASPPLRSKSTPSAPRSGSRPALSPLTLFALC